MSERRRLEGDLEQYSASANAVLELERTGRRGNWMLYTAAAGSALGMASAADAAIIYSGVQNVTIDRAQFQSSTASGFKSSSGYGYVDLDGNAFPDVYLGLFRSRFPGSYDSGAAGLAAYGGVLVAGTASPAYSSARRLSSGATIGPGGIFDSYGAGLRGVFRSGSYSTVYGQWPGGAAPGTTGFAGLYFYDYGGDKHYAWLRLRLENDADGYPDKITVVDWAYQTTPDAPIRAGQEVPEPSPLGLLALGAAGVAALRRRRRAAA